MVSQQQSPGSRCPRKSNKKPWRRHVHRHSHFLGIFTNRLFSTAKTQQTYMTLKPGWEGEPERLAAGDASV